MIAVIALSAALNALTLPKKRMQNLAEPAPMTAAETFYVTGAKGEAEEIFTIYPDGSFHCGMQPSPEALGQMMSNGPEFLATYAALCGRKIP